MYVVKLGFVNILQIKVESLGFIVRLCVDLQNFRFEHTETQSFIMATKEQQTVYSNGIFHGLPTFPKTKDLTGLTAIITGANGISGYHMVKVLAAAPERWKKIYCLSRRPPPDYFFAGLGQDAASRVEHVSIDFLDDPTSIAEGLKNHISQV